MNSAPRSIKDNYAVDAHSGRIQVMRDLSVFRNLKMKRSKYIVMVKCKLLIDYKPLRRLSKQLPGYARLLGVLSK